jgi:hypothetical protein
MNLGLEVVVRRWGSVLKPGEGRERVCLEPFFRLPTAKEEDEDGSGRDTQTEYKFAMWFVFDACIF